MGGPSLIATLGANISGFVRDLETAKGHAKKSGEGIGSAFGDELSNKLGHLASAVGIEEAFRRTYEWAEKLSNLSARTGLGTTELQKLEGIAAKTGTSVESLAGFYERLGKAMAGAHKEGPGGETSEAIGRLGVSEDTIGSGDMAAAMQEVATHFQRIGEITPQVEADLSKIFKNAREVIPALKGMTEEESLFNETVAVAPEKMAAMAIVMESLKDGWRVITGFGKNFIGTISEGWLKIGQLGKASFAGIFGGQKAFSESMDASLAAQKKKQDELAGQKAGQAKFAKTKEEEAADKKADQLAAQKEAHDVKELASLREKTEEEQRRGKLAGMTHNQRVAALKVEVDALENHARLGKWASESDVEFARTQLELAKKKNELETEERAADKDEPRKQKTNAQHIRDLEINSLQKSGFVVGNLSAAPEMAMLDVQKKSESHLAAIRKGIDRVTQNRPDFNPFGDTEF